MSRRQSDPVRVAGTRKREGAAPSAERKSRRTLIREGSRSAFGTLLLLPCIVVGLALWPSAASGQACSCRRGGRRRPVLSVGWKRRLRRRHYDLELKYDPATDLLEGRATIRAKATQNLSSFNLDLVGLTCTRLP
jgi:hypothetical protein